jgi:hypothetical protein
LVEVRLDNGSQFRSRQVVEDLYMPVPDIAGAHDHKLQRVLLRHFLLRD